MEEPKKSTNRCLVAGPDDCFEVKCKQIWLLIIWIALLVTHWHHFYTFFYLFNSNK